MLTRIRLKIVRPGISRPRVAACLVAVAAAFASSSAYAQGCSGGGGGRAGASGAGMAGGSGISTSGLPGVSLAAAGQVRTGQALFSVPTLAMFEPAYPHIVDDNKQYVAARRAMREAKLAQARERLALRSERSAKKPRTVATVARS